MTKEQLISATPQQIAANYQGAYQAIRENNEALSGFAEVKGTDYTEFRAVVTNIEILTPTKKHEIFPNGNIVTTDDYYL